MSTGSQNPPHVAVAGAGVVGTACALALLRAGHPVTLLDRDTPGNGCSAGNAGVIATDAVLPLATPGLLRRLPAMLLDPLGPTRIDPASLPGLLPWLLRFFCQARAAHVHAASAALATLQRPALPAWRELLASVGASDLLRENGWVRAYRTRRGFEVAAAERELKRRHGIRFEVWSEREIGARLPALHGRIHHAVWFPDAASVIDPRAVVEALARGFVAEGGELRRTRVEAIEPHGSGARLRTASGDLLAGRALIALGARSGRFARRLGDPVPLVAERGYHLMLPGVDPGLTCPVLFEEEHFVATPMRGGLRLTGGSELARLRAPPRYRRADVLLRLARRYLSGLDGAAPTRWMGERPTLADSLPVLGSSTRHPQISYAFGHQHLGLTLAAITARVMGESFTGAPASVALDAFRAGRF